MLPPALQAGIDEIVGAVDPRELKRTAQALSERYRVGGAPGRRASRSTADVAAYLATRAPATYAAAAEVFREIRLARPDWVPRSIVDLGAGPGIAAWAAVDVWPDVAAVTLIDAEPEMILAGKRLAAAGPPTLQAARWAVSDARPDEAAQLVIASYVIGELPPAAFDAFVSGAWASAADTFVVVEPGTTAGYRRVLDARAAVLARGGRTLAPCPHDDPCPLLEGDWCHFAVRLQRTRAHRAAKDAERGFEDEKFAYVVLTRARHPRAEARVIRRPETRQGHVLLDLCLPSGLEQRTISKREGDAYRRARKVRWGDRL